jgi:hypothetical protein
MKHRPVAAAALAAALLLGCERERFGAPPPGPHLRSRGTIAYFLDASASDALELGAREAFQLWSDATDFDFAYGGKAKARAARDGRNQVVLMRRWPEELSIRAPSWCQAYVDKDGAIIEADILLNLQAFGFTARREAKQGCLYIEEVLAKAIGRSIGIGLGEDPGDAFRPAAAGDAFEPGIGPAEMAAYLSLYKAQ